tara:strand:- start:166 stop:342 length:177 start_codon:yes stop_codon:yes gene_type:complete
MSPERKRREEAASPQVEDTLFNSPIDKALRKAQKRLREEIEDLRRKLPTTDDNVTISV